MAFFKRSKLPVATLRELWPLASVYKGTSLCKEEFLVFTAYIMFVQGSQPPGAGFSAPTTTPPLTFPNLCSYFNQASPKLPQFEGLDLPQPPPTPAFDPFGDEAESEGFGDFGDFGSAAA